jgi:hypothetical protein
MTEVPKPDAAWDEIAKYPHTSNGYEYFGDDWAAGFKVVRERFFETDELPDEVDELRACLFCEFRMDRFNWGDDVTLSEPDESGTRTVIPNPDFEKSPTQRYRRAVVARIRELVH